MRLFVIISILLIFSTELFSQDEDYPIPPKTNELLFYIQRNHNANTIIYDANFDGYGNLVQDKPINVYWVRYDENGQKMKLRTIEKWYAYGVECSKSKDDTCFKVELAANSKKEFKLLQTAPNKAVLTTSINGKLSVLEHMYIFADNTGIWPKVKYIDVFGYDIASGENTFQKIVIE